MGRGRIPLTSAINAETAHTFFYAKVAGVRASTENASPPVFSAVTSDCSLRDFRQLTVNDVIAAIRQLPDKQCAADPLPTRLLKDNVDLLAPFLVELFTAPWCLVSSRLHSRQHLSRRC